MSWTPITKYTQILILKECHIVECNYSVTFFCAKWIKYTKNLCIAKGMMSIVLVIDKFKFHRANSYVRTTNHTGTLFYVIAEA